MKYCLAIINNEVLSFAITSIKLYSVQLVKGKSKNNKLSFLYRVGKKT